MCVCASYEAVNLRITMKCLAIAALLCLSACGHKFSTVSKPRTYAEASDSERAQWSQRDAQLHAEAKAAPKMGLEEGKPIERTGHPDRMNTVMRVVTTVATMHAARTGTLMTCTDLGNGLHSCR